MHTAMPIGIDDFETVRKGYYFVDKTPFISKFLPGHPAVLLLTRPRRFGKTLLLSMLRYFFDIEGAEEHRKLFDGLAVSRDAIIMTEQGTRPVLFLTLRLATALSSRKLLKKYSREVPFSFSWKGLLHIPFSKYINLLTSRATSMYSLTDKVFMKHIRSLNYATIYEDPKWQNRRIMSALYELCTGKNWLKHLVGEEKEMMTPSEAIIKNSDIAAEMGTTLWWSDHDRAIGKPEALVTTGQYNICWNLLEFIYRLRRNNENLSPESKVILELQETLEADWKRFQENPGWLLDEVNNEFAK